MKLEFEKWLDNQRISLLAKDVLKESIICYKVSAYRASMMLAFTGFQLILKDRINAASDPGGLTPPNKWNYILENLKDSDKWDALIATEVIPATDPNKRIFEINDDLINQYKFWKYRRNDAAHSKDNKIAASHLESFWLFLESNLPKFVVRGSKQELTNRIKTYFNLNETPLSTTFKSIIDDIPATIDTKKVQDFLVMLKSITEQSRRPKEQLLAFWDALLGIRQIQEDVQIFMLKEENQHFFYSIIQYNPKWLVYLHDQQTFVRRIYLEWLFNDYNLGDFQIFSHLLKQNLIPDDERGIILSKLLKKFHRLHYANGNYIPVGENLDLLINVFSPIWEDDIISNLSNSGSRMDWGNSGPNRAFVINFIKFNGLSKKFVEKICDIFSKPYSPWGLANWLIAFFKDSENTKMKTEFLRIIAENNYKLPKQLEQINLAESTDQGGQLDSEE